MAMSLTAYNWTLALHLFGVVLWVGAMISLALVLSSDAAKSDGGILAAARKLARVMDIGALGALVCGIYHLDRPRSLGEAWALKQPWMHIKLTVVVLAVFGGHGFVEATLKRLRTGTGKPLPSFLAPALISVVFIVVYLAIVKPLAKGG